MHADDTHLTYASGNALDIGRTLSADLKNVHNWLRTDEPTILNMTNNELTLFSSDLSSTSSNSTAFSAPVRFRLGCYLFLFFEVRLETKGKLIGP